MFVPSDSGADEPVSKEVAQLAKCMGGKVKAELNLNPAQWSTAYDRYAIASVSAGQWSLAAAWAHKARSQSYCVHVVMCFCVFDFAGGVPARRLPCEKRRPAPLDVRHLRRRVP